jgi:hypothetical protein
VGSTPRRAAAPEEAEHADDPEEGGGPADDDLQQLNLGKVPRSLIDALRRLAALDDKTMSQWAIDELEAAVMRDDDKVREYFKKVEAGHERLLRRLEAKHRK